MDMGIPEGCGALQRARRQLRPCYWRGKEAPAEAKTRQGDPRLPPKSLGPREKNPTRESSPCPSWQKSDPPASPVCSPPQEAPLCFPAAAGQDAVTHPFVPCLDGVPGQGHPFCPPTPPTSGQGTLAPEPSSAARSRPCPGHDGHNTPPKKPREGIGGGGGFSILPAAPLPTEPGSSPVGTPRGCSPHVSPPTTYHHLIYCIHNVQHLVPRDVPVVVQVVQLKRPCKPKQRRGAGDRPPSPPPTARHAPHRRPRATPPGPFPGNTYTSASRPASPGR